MRKCAVVATTLLFGSLISLQTSVAQPQPGSTNKPPSTLAMIEITDTKGNELKLKQGEKIAFMFMEAIASMEDDCHRHLSRLCPLAELVKGPNSPAWKIGKLKFDPATDSNYRYSVSITGDKWQAQAVPQRAVFGGWMYDGSSFSPHRYYSERGPASASSRQLSSVSIDGDSFRER
jgi:hypothetical protein